MTRSPRAGAIREYEAKYDIVSRLTAFDPTNAHWQRDLAVSTVSSP
jgi:hypothetical protein